MTSRNAIYVVVLLSLLGVSGSVLGWFPEVSPTVMLSTLGILLVGICAYIARLNRQHTDTIDLLEQQIEDRFRGLLTQNEQLTKELMHSRIIEETTHLQVRAFESMLQGVCVCDASLPGMPLIYVNAGFTRITGYESNEVLGRSCTFLQGKDTNPESLRRIHEAFRLKESCTVEILNYRKDGTPFWNAMSISPVFEDGRLIHYVAVQTDITTFKELEQQLRQSQKMEAIGHLAGGVAHDFNNLLTVINGCSELMLNNQLNEENHLLAEEINKAGNRASNLTRQLLAFSRKTFLQPKVLSLNELIADFHKMLVRIIGEDIELTTSLQAKHDTVRVDPGQIEQVIMNLASNARDAMPQGGSLSIETSDTYIDEREARKYEEVKPGRYAAIIVRDTGCGMEDKTLSRIFEPFFTTKPVGKGTGLGLAMVYGIIKASQGHISVESVPGSGTVFRIYLPLAENSVRLPMTPVEQVAPAKNERILLVEDESGVRSLARHILQSNGYQVIVAKDADDAIQQFGDYSGQIDLLITDVVMPRQSGGELSQQLCLLEPSLKVLYISGYTDDAIVQHGILASECDFLQKPFGVNALLRKVREIIDRKESRV